MIWSATQLYLSRIRSVWTNKLTLVARYICDGSQVSETLLIELDKERLGKLGPNFRLANAHYQLILNSVMRSSPNSLFFRC